MPYPQWMAKSKVPWGVHGFSWRKRSQESRRRWSGIKCTIKSSPSLWRILRFNEKTVLNFFSQVFNTELHYSWICAITTEGLWTISRNFVSESHASCMLYHKLVTKQQCGAQKTEHWGERITVTRYSTQYHSKILVPKWNSLSFK